MVRLRINMRTADAHHRQFSTHDPCGAFSLSPCSRSSKGPPARYTPPPGAKDLKAVLFNWFWHMGMLRGPQENEAVATLEHKATGPFRWTANRAS